MLLERYDDYSSRAKMMTEIHAPSTKSNDEDGCSIAKKQLASIDKKIQDKKKEKLLKDKKRVLKRL